MIKMGVLVRYSPLRLEYGRTVQRLSRETVEPSRGRTVPRLSRETVDASRDRA